MTKKQPTRRKPASKLRKLKLPPVPPVPPGPLKVVLRDEGVTDAALLFGILNEERRALVLWSLIAFYKQQLRGLPTWRPPLDGPLPVAQINDTLREGHELAQQVWKMASNIHGF
jgi:hypothetical protein